MLITQSQQHNPACPRCSSKFSVKKGRRKNRFRALQVFQCSECFYKFTAAAGKNKSYPPGVILETVSTYNLGNSLSDTQRVVRKRLHVDIPEGTIRSWIRAHKPLTTYARLRAPGRRLLDPETILRNYAMRHKQVYRFGLHQAKLELLLQIARHRHLAPAKEYLETIGQDFPHDMFQATEHRSSNSPRGSGLPSCGKKTMRRGLRPSCSPAQPRTKSATRRSSGSCSSTTLPLSPSKSRCTLRARTLPTTGTADSSWTSRMTSSPATSTFCRFAMGIYRSSITSPRRGKRSMLTSNLRSMRSHLPVEQICHLSTSSVRGS